MKNKVAVVSGGASGIGAACCRLFAREGARVAVLDRDESAAALLRDSLGGGALALAVDVSSEAQVQAAMLGVVEQFGGIDVLVNNAGIAVRCPAGELDDQDWQRVMDVNLRGAFLCSKHAVPHLPSGGSVIHMSSVVGITGVRNRAVYSASKGGLVALTRNMAMDYAPRGIRVNCVCPGFVRTPFTAGLFADHDRKSKVEALHPLGRLGEPEDIASAVLFLASDEAAWITGIALPVDGGFSAGHGIDI